MSIKLQIALLIASIVTVTVVTIFVVKYKMNVKYGVVWILWGLIMLFFSLFPDMITYLSNLLGVQTPSNTVFLITIFLVYILSFYIFMKISKQNDEIKNLTYQIALVEKKLSEKVNKDE